MNPLTFNRQVLQQFLRYQRTTFPLADPDLAKQAAVFLDPSNPESTPLRAEPWLSVSRPFETGRSLAELTDAPTPLEQRVHPAILSLFNMPNLYAHQDDALCSLMANRNVLVSTGTGSGKTEAFLLPIIDHCLKLRDAGEPDGLTALLIYPMNALASDQLDRLRGLLAGTGISYGLYVGLTPHEEADVSNVIQLKDGEGGEELQELREKNVDRHELTVVPFEERLSREAMAERPPRILLTNVNQLELLLTRGKDHGIFRDAPLKYLVMDEAHTYTGARGAEVAALIRRLKAISKPPESGLLSIGTSATLTDPNLDSEDPDLPAKLFAHRFFGVDVDSVDVIGERYQEENWPSPDPDSGPLGSEGPSLHDNILACIEEDIDVEAINELLPALSLQPLTHGDSGKQLHDQLLKHPVVQAIGKALTEPRSLSDTVSQVWDILGRSSLPDDRDQHEVLLFMALAAIAVDGDTPLLRPTIHAFIQGLQGMAGTLGDHKENPTQCAIELHPSEKAARENIPHDGTETPLHPFPMLCCPSCGQHVLEAFVDDLVMEKTQISGGQAHDTNILWKRQPDELAEHRILLTNRFVVEEASEEESIEDRLDRRRHPVHVCRGCGSLHDSTQNHCSGCGLGQSLLPMWALTNAGTQSGATGRILVCPSCKARGFDYPSLRREPYRPIKAIGVADVHILGQEMLRAADKGHRKVIIFSDNRQDAAFQAGWMRDHARRYRLRQVLFNQLRSLHEENDTPVAIGDLVQAIHSHLSDTGDGELARQLVPEVFASEVEEAFSNRLKKELMRYLHMFVIRELATSARQRMGLEAWGLMLAVYHGLNEEDEDIKNSATAIGLSASDLVSVLNSLLDHLRRKRIFYYEAEHIFTRSWHNGCEEVQKKYINLLPPPVGIKLQKSELEKGNTKIVGFITEIGQTHAYGYLRKLFGEADHAKPATQAVWDLLVSKGWLEPVTVLDAKGKAMKGMAGLYQVSASKMGLVPHDHRYRCDTCRQVWPRSGPQRICITHNCKGRCSKEYLSEDNYDLSLLLGELVILTPEEHTAQVPSEQREVIERSFKDPNGSVNCLVATPTLEMGVDIGALDIVMMRNVPPLPSNYWQRAGRAGRRHRMAVSVTYCRINPHDAYFFEDPGRLLVGRILPPRLNLRNPVLVRKHAHAVILGELIALSNGNIGTLDDNALESLQLVLDAAFPRSIRSYLIDEKGSYAIEAPTHKELTDTIQLYREHLHVALRKSFTSQFPEESSDLVSPEAMTEIIDDFSSELSKTSSLIHKRFKWALDTRNRLNSEAKSRALEIEEERLQKRVERYIKSLTSKYSNNSSQRLQTYTLAVLAQMGFLPGYGNSGGQVTANIERAWSPGWKGARSFSIQRPTSIAVREFVPGNLIYANGGRYGVSFYQLKASEETVEPDGYRWMSDIGRVLPADQQQGGHYSEDAPVDFVGIPIHDVEMAFKAHIDDDERFRFRMPVVIAGYLKDQHRGGARYQAGEFDFQHTFGQGVRLVNIGPGYLVSGEEPQLGYPLCRICGATRSPDSHEKVIENFIEKHTKSCGKPPQLHALTADANVDLLLFTDFETQKDAINFIEGLRQGMLKSIEMDIDDLQMLLLPQSEERFDVALYDPMPGGSGLIDQLVESWRNVLHDAIANLEGCMRSCETSCYSCLRRYRNMFHHSELDRHRAIEVLRDWECDLSKMNDIAAVRPMMGAPTPGGITHSERTVGQWLVECGFTGFDSNIEIFVTGLGGKSKPDFVYRDETTNTRIAIFVDGGVHQTAATSQKDRIVRMALENDGWTVIAILNEDLNDPQVMEHYRIKISRALS